MTEANIQQWKQPSGCYTLREKGQKTIKYIFFIIFRRKCFLYASRDADSPPLPSLVYQFGLVMLLALTKDKVAMHLKLLDCVAACLSSGCETNRKNENLFGT